MKNVLKIIAMTVFGFSAHAAMTNQQLISKEILGRTFCYVDTSQAGWFFGKNGVAVRHAVNLGMPGSSSYYQLTFVESPRTIGYFTLANSTGKILFQFTAGGIFEYSTGKILSINACYRR